MKEHTQECCLKFEIEKWDKKTFTLHGKHFIKETIPTFFHVPFPPMIEKKVMKLHDLATKAKATIPDKTEALILFRDPSPFTSEIYYAVTKEVEGANNTAVSGVFVSMVFDGPYNAIPRYMQEMEKYLNMQNQTAKDYYVQYAYCPECAKANGHNYIVLFAQV